MLEEKSDITESDRKIIGTANEITLGEGVEILITSTVTAGHRLGICSWVKTFCLIFEDVILIFADSQQSHGQLSRIVWEKQSRMQLLPCFSCLPNSLTYQNRQNNEAKTVHF